jgi:hypothetical protein
MAFSTVLHLGSTGRPRRRASGQPTAGILTRRDRTARPVGDRRGSAGSGNRTMPRPRTDAGDGPGGRPPRTGPRTLPTAPGIRRAPARTRTGRWPTPTPGPSSNRRGSGNDGAEASSSVRDTRGSPIPGARRPGIVPSSSRVDSTGPGRTRPDHLGPFETGPGPAGNRHLRAAIPIETINNYIYNHHGVSLRRAAATMGTLPRSESIIGLTFPLYKGNRV